MLFKKILITLVVFTVGFVLSYLFLLESVKSSSPLAVKNLVTSIGFHKHEIIGFLPYWLIDKADKDYPQNLTILTYFGLVVNPDGSIQKLLNATEEEPGWHALRTGKADKFFADAKKNNVNIALTVFSGSEGAIAGLISDPASRAATLVSEVSPIMKQYGFSELNLDIESFAPNASDSAQENFTEFVKTTREKMSESQLGTLSIDVSPTDLVKKRLINLAEVNKFVDRVILMTYDYHYAGSLVTGPVSPNSGAGVNSEFDVETGVQKALEIIPKEKIILGIPLYGYEWETINNKPRSGVLPGSGVVISNRRAEDFLASCASCSAILDEKAGESYYIYEDQETGTFHQIFYPDQKFMEEKIKLANKYELSGAALWAIGYEGTHILSPIKEYKETLSSY